MSVRAWVLSMGVLTCAIGGLSSAAPGQERRVIDDAFPGGYQVEVADVNGDKRPDIVALGGGTLAWYENPMWKKRVVTGPKRTPGVISSATADLDGDGKAEIAIAFEFAMNKPSSGKLALAYQGSTPDKEWSLLTMPIEGNVHRLRWGDVNGDGRRLELIAAPIFGREARPPIFEVPAGVNMLEVNFSHSRSGGSVSMSGSVVARHPVIHAIEVIDADGDGKDDLLTASNDGVELLLGAQGEPVALTRGATGPAPKRGSSEVHLGRLADGRRFLATVEPWHGSTVAICYAGGEGAKGDGKGDGKGRGAFHFSPRTVIDDTLDDGHALWVADVDGDGDDEVFAGHRGKDHRVSLYDFERERKTWKRTVLDRDIAAQDLRGGDLDGDGTPDVVAIGGSTHNVVWYHFPKPAGEGSEKGPPSGRP